MQEKTTQPTASWLGNETRGRTALGGGGGKGQHHLQDHRDGLLACLGCTPLPVRVGLEKVFCTMGLQTRVETWRFVK